MDRDARTPAGEPLDVGSTADRIEESVPTEQLTMVGFLCNRMLQAPSEGHPLWDLGRATRGR